MFLLYPFFALGSLVVTLASVLVLNWIVVLFADNSGNLPNWLSYFQTFDNTLDAGENKFSSRYLNRVMWLMRNPAYGWDYYVFGLKWNKDDWTVRKYTTDGTNTTFIATNKNGAFNFYYVGKFGKWKFGWKAWNYYQASTNAFTGSFGDSTHVPVCIS